MCEKAPPVPIQIFVAWERDHNAAEGEGWYLTAVTDPDGLAEMGEQRLAGVYALKRRVTVCNNTTLEEEVIG